MTASHNTITFNYRHLEMIDYLNDRRSRPECDFPRRRSGAEKDRPYICTRTFHRLARPFGRRQVDIATMPERPGCPQHRPCRSRNIRRLIRSSRSASSPAANRHGLSTAPADRKAIRAEQCCDGPARLSFDLANPVRTSRHGSRNCPGGSGPCGSAGPGLAPGRSVERRSAAAGRDRARPRPATVPSSWRMSRLPAWTRARHGVSCRSWSGSAATTTSPRSSACIKSSSPESLPTALSGSRRARSCLTVRLRL